jgi:pyruvate/2-oxoglutarate dehydrogenase complex dihydrolipoamide acyltransferase (E2) component
MSKQDPAYEVKPFPLSRRAIIDSARIGKRKHTIRALIEVDVTKPRDILRAYKARTGETISFTAFILTCLGKAIDRNRYLHARRDLWGRLILFEEVDCTTMIEIELQGQKFPLAHIMRAINKRSLRDIHDEIRAVQADSKASESLQRPMWLMGAFLLLPAFIRDVIYGVVSRFPRLFKQQAGTVVVTAVGLLLGGIAEKPGVVDGQVAVREYLNLTVEVDHDIVDGAPATRFVSRLKEYIESGYGLSDFEQGVEK